MYIILTDVFFLVVESQLFLVGIEFNCCILSIGLITNHSDDR